MDENNFEYQFWGLLNRYMELLEKYEKALEIIRYPDDSKTQKLK